MEQKINIYPRFKSFLTTNLHLKSDQKLERITSILSSSWSMQLKKNQVLVV